MVHLLGTICQDSKIRIAILACSKGAEVYSILWKIRSVRTDLRVIATAVDISQKVVDFAAAGAYSLRSFDTRSLANGKPTRQVDDMNWKDQLLGHHALSMFERMTSEELHQMFDVNGEKAMIRPWLKEGITWLCADAMSSDFAALLGPQEIVVANRFLCHMKPSAAEACLRNLSRLVKPGGYIFVSGIDLDVRAKVARDLGWRPVTHLIKEVYEGDNSLMKGWPLEYWGLEPFSQEKADWQIRFASVFKIERR